MDERKAIEVAIGIMVGDRENLKNILHDFLLTEDWVGVTDASIELRVIDTKLELLKKVLEKMPG